MHDPADHDGPALGSFTGTERFEVLRELGSGGAGVVYAARDRERGTTVALKKLSDLSPDGVFRFKREFREFRDLTHPHLVALHELHCEHGVWFFSMEFVAGLDFVRWVRPGGMLDDARLREALAQLTFALLALHDAGKVHRDVKPSNIVVAAGGRLVLLDFGIAGDTLKRSTGAVCGTVAYMAPEQAAGETLGPAADWYAVGVMLFEALTGQLPCSGSVYEILLSKIQPSNVRPRALVPQLPEDLDQLCADLMAADVAARPDGRAILERLARAEPDAARADPEFVGREAELAELAAHFRASRQELRALAVVGDSGVGKTSLLRRFAQLLSRRDPSLVVLTSSCHEREQVPFQAVDGLMDGLSSFLRRQPTSEVADFLPERVGLIGQAFPVLGRVAAIGDAPGVTAPDMRERRDLLFAVLRELITRLAARHPLLLILEDVQWADSDSVALLTHVLREPDAPRLLLVASLRSDIAGPPALASKLRRLPLEPLAPRDAEALARHLAQRSDSTDSIDASAIAHEAGGHPLFIDVLVRHAARRTSLPMPLEEAFAAEIRALGAAPRALLQGCAIAAGPVSAQLAAQAAQLAGDQLDTIVGELRRARLLRVAAGGRIEPYHARVRAAALASIDVDRERALHARLAVALEASRGDPEALAHHYRLAGQLPEAAHHAALAARKASHALAFGRAVEFYELCLELSPQAPGELWGRYGEALANAGRGGNAGRAYLRAAEQASAAEALGFRRRAADQLLRSGHVDEGLAALATVMRAAKLGIASTPRRAFWSLALARLRLRLRGLAIVERRAEQIPAEVLARVDLYSTATAGLAVIDPILGADFQTRALLLALDAGEPARVAYGLCLEASLVAVGGSRTQLRTDELLTHARHLVNRLGEPKLLGMLALVTGMIALLRGQWQAARRQCLDAEVILRDRCVGVAWELDSARWFGISSTYWTGDISALRRVSEWLLESEARGDLFAIVNLRTVLTPLQALFDDAPARARSEVEAGLALWSRRGFHVQHLNAELMLAQTQLYEGDVVAATERMRRLDSAFRRSHLHSIQLYRIWSQHIRGSAALQAGLPKAARAVAGSLEREQMPWASALATLLRAGVDAASPQATAGWQAAAQTLAASGLDLPAACARWRAKDPSGEAWLLERGVKNPLAIANLFAPCVSAPRSALLLQS